MEKCDNTNYTTFRRSPAFTTSTYERETGLLKNFTSPDVQDADTNSFLYQIQNMQLTHSCEAPIA